jgi:hypothetical protein
MHAMTAMKSLGFAVSIMLFATETFAEPSTKPTTAPASPSVVHITIDASKDRVSISPYIYGANQHAKRASEHPLTRIGGNRWTAYNWETNASNAGADWHHQNDDFLSKSHEPGEAVRVNLDSAGRHRQAIIVTVPTCGYVSADKAADGDVNQTVDYLNKRFHKSLAKKSGTLALKPDTSDAFVYQDEFVNWVETTKQPNQIVWYSLDNEPDIWSATHARIHPEKLTYAEIVQKTIEYAGAIKDVKRDALIFAPANYGWNGYRTLQIAPDANGRDFHQFYLAEMKKAEETSGRRLLDVLDVHWYPEATGDGVRVTGAQTSPGVVDARIQSPRSLWDPTYVETSWITKDNTHGQPIVMLTRLKRDVEQFYPGTKIAITEYNYGGGDHISGGIAQADVLGIFAREGIFAACWWPESEKTEFIDAAFEIYLKHFGDTSVRATTNDVAATSVYASVDSRDPSRMSIVLINKTDHMISAELNIAGDKKFAKYEMVQLTSKSGTLETRGERPLNDHQCEMPAMSVIVLKLSH